MENANSYLFIDNSKIHGRGLFTNIDIPINTRLFLVGDLMRYYQDLTWITDLGRLVNHQKNGNCILLREGNFFILYSCRNIKANEELTSDYTTLPKPFKNTVDGYKEFN